jgi:hypothetical protein
MGLLYTEWQRGREERMRGRSSQRAYPYLEFHLHERGLWWEAYAFPFHAHNVADILRACLEPRELVVWGPVTAPPLSEVFCALELPWRRVSDRCVATGAQALPMLEDLHMDRRAGHLADGDYGWCEAPLATGDCGLVEKLVLCAWTGKRDIDDRVLTRLEETGVRFVYVGGDGHYARLYIRLREAASVFAAYAIRFFIKNEPGKAWFQQPPQPGTGLPGRRLLPLPDEEFSWTLASYSVDMGVTCRVSDLSLRGSLVSAKCWRGHMDVVSADVRHPQVSDVNESFEVQYDVERSEWHITDLLADEWPGATTPIRSSLGVMPRYEGRKGDADPDSGSMLECNAWTSADLQAPETASAVCDALASGPSWLPLCRMGPSALPRQKFEPEEARRILQTASRCDRHSVGGSLYVDGRPPGGHEQDPPELQICLRWEKSALSGFPTFYLSTWSPAELWPPQAVEGLQWWAHILATMGADFGYICSLAGTESKLVPIDVDLRCCLPGVYWANYYGPVYVEFLGRERLLGAPWSNVSELPGGSMVCLTCAVPGDWHRAETLARQAAVRAYLGEDCFFDHDPGHFARAPVYDFSAARHGAPRPIMDRVVVAIEDATGDVAELIREAERLAMEFRRQARCPDRLDYSVGSLTSLDRELRRARKRDMLDSLPLVRQIAGYYGEVLRRSFGGVWRGVDFPMLRVMLAWEQREGYSLNKHCRLVARGKLAPERQRNGDAGVVGLGRARTPHEMLLRAVLYAAYGGSLTESQLI